MELVNLTPHNIKIKTRDGFIVIPPSPLGPARVDMDEVVVGQVNGIPLVRVSPGDTNLPEQKSGVVYIVSRMVLDAVGHQRGDLVAPDTGDTAVRNEKGHIEYVTRLIKEVAAN